MSVRQEAYRLRRRWLTLLAVLVVAAGGLLFLVVGLATRLSGEYVAWQVPVAGLLTVVLSVVALLLTSRPRRPPPAVAVEGGVALPLRRGYAGLVAALPVLVGAIGLTVASLDDRGWVRALAGVALVALVALGGWLASAGPAARIVVSPEGLRLPRRSTGRREWSWSAVAGVRLVHGFVPLLLVEPTDGRAAPAFTRVYPLGWSVESVEALVDHYRGARTARGELTSPEAVDRFRG